MALWGAGKVDVLGGQRSTVRHWLFQRFTAGALCASALAAALTATAPAALAIEELPFIKPVTEEPPSGTAADFSADKLTFDPDSELAIATGRVVIT
jgi:hypothetical protein